MLRTDELEILQRAVDTYGEDAQLKMVLEEMSELQKEICKQWRGKDNAGNVAEELADLEIMLDQVRLMFGFDNEVEQYRDAKLRRLKERLDEEDRL